MQRSKHLRVHNMSTQDEESKATLGSRRAYAAARNIPLSRMYSPAMRHILRPAEVGGGRRSLIDYEKADAILTLRPPDRPAGLSLRLPAIRDARVSEFERAVADLSKGCEDFFMEAILEKIACRAMHRAATPTEAIRRYRLLTTPADLDDLIEMIFAEARPVLEMAEASLAVRDFTLWTDRFLIDATGWDDTVGWKEYTDLRDRLAAVVGLPRMVDDPFYADDDADEAESAA